MFRYILIICLIISVVTSGYSQGLGLTFMSEVGQMNLTNPALFPEKRFYLGIGTPYAALSTSIGGGENLFIINGGQYVANFDQFVENLDDDNFIRLDAAAYPIMFGFRSKNWTFTFHTAAKSYVQATVPRDFAGVLLKGNAAYIGQTVELNPEFKAGAYQEVALGASYTLLKIITVGARAKYLIGQVGLETTNSNISLTTDEEYYQLAFSGDYGFNLGGLPEINLDDTTGNFNYEFNLITQNRGLAIDLGATAQLGKFIQVGIGILDLGGITYEEDAYSYDASGTFEFDGFDISGYVTGEESNFGSVIDSLTESVDLSSSPRQFRASLSPKLYTSAKIRLGKKFDVGVVLRNEFTGAGVKTGLGVGVQKTFGKTLSVGVMYSIQNGSFQNIGANASVKLGPIQAFVVSDNILPLTSGNPYTAANTNVRLGLNFTLNEKKKDD